jgi:glycosyltransferase involved in cell wall biosynthesis
MSKKKILLLSDDLRMTSGIATMSKEIVLGTLHKYDWVQLGGAIKHPEYGKVVDINDDVRKRTGIEDANLKIIPYNGYGDINILRKLILEEKPDAILHFTDPHYWGWLYDNEHEIRQQCPILYYHIWDNLPDPKYNRDCYESCDWIGAISKQTYGIVHRVGKMNNEPTFKPLEDWQISYVPHGINSDVFKPIDKISDEFDKFLFSKKKYEFILFYNNRNIRRKQPSDVILSYKLFCDKLTKEQSEKCLLLMHTAPVDDNGTDLNAVKDAVCPDYDVKFTNIKLEQDKLNELYNAVDCTINIANNEGFGLTTVESLMAGTPIIANVTGGLQDQMGFDFTADDYIEIGSLHNKNKSMHLVQEGDWVVPVWPVANNLNGSVPTPYIFDDRVNDEDVANAIHKVYLWGKDERKERGLKGREFAIENFSSKVMCDKMIEGIETALKNYKPREKFNLYKLV